MFPIWGTCLGFEIILMLLGGIYPLKKYDAKNARYPLKWTRATKDSRMWSGPNMTPNYLKYLSTNPSTLNNHTWGISPQKFRANVYLNKLFIVTSTSLDDKGAEFVESFEGRNNLPIYGIQWHPERQPKEMGPLLDFWADDIKKSAINHLMKPLGKTYTRTTRKGHCTQYPEHSRIECLFIPDGSDHGGSIDEKNVPLFIKNLLGHWAYNFHE
jgi:gamma-glutamyl hydrolase